MTGSGTLSDHWRSVPGTVTAWARACSWAVAVVAWTVIAGACASASTSDNDTATPANERNEHPPVGALSLLVPEGAEVVMASRPAELLEADATRRIVDAVLPKAFFARFEKRYGVDPRAVDELLVADHEDGILVLARGELNAAELTRALGKRMNTVEIAGDTPLVRRVGYLGTERRHVVALADDVVAVGRGDALMASLLRRVMHGDWAPDQGAALAGHAITPLRRAHARAPLALYVPRRLELPPGHDVSLLLAQQRVLAASVVARDGAQLDVRVGLRGEFPEGASENFRRMVESIAHSPLGGALGLPEALHTLRVQVERGQRQGSSVGLRMRLPADAVAKGLRVLLVAELEEILDTPLENPGATEDPGKE